MSKLIIYSVHDEFGSLTLSLIF